MSCGSPFTLVVTCHCDCASKIMTLLTRIQGLAVAGSVKMSCRWLSEKQILDLLQTNSYSDSEGDEFEDSNEEEFILLQFIR